MSWLTYALCGAVGYAVACLLHLKRDLDRNCTTKPRVTWRGPFPPPPPLPTTERDAQLETIRRLTKQLAQLKDALTWRPAPEVVTEQGQYLVRLRAGELPRLLWLARHENPSFATHIAGPLPLREGGES